MLNFPTKLIRLTKATLTIVTCCVKIQNVSSESFETRQGLRQGTVLSIHCFLMSCWKLSWDEQTYKQLAQSTTKKHKILAYADDIDIVGRSQLAVLVAYLELKVEAAKVGFTINYQKTKYMIAARNDRMICDAWQLATNTL
jgi:hypothetical protein